MQFLKLNHKNKGNEQYIFILTHEKSVFLSFTGIKNLITYNLTSSVKEYLIYTLA